MDDEIQKLASEMMNNPEFMEAIGYVTSKAEAIKRQIEATKVVGDYLIEILKEQENPALDREAMLTLLKRQIDFYEAELVMLQTKLDLVFD
jgi:hypothetical protein